MPTYIYQCNQCFDIKEKFFKLSKYKDKIKCDKCKTLSMDNVIQPTSTHFKGSWPGEDIKNGK